MTNLCQHEGCTRRAQFAPKVMVPATGTPIDMHTPLSILFGARYCREHCESFKPDFDSGGPPPLRYLYEMMARAACQQARRSYIAPDFSRAFTQKVRLDSEEWRKFDELRRRQA